jgi:hypothetical protein
VVAVLADQAEEAERLVCGGGELVPDLGRAELGDVSRLAWQRSSSAGSLMARGRCAQSERYDRMQLMPMRSPRPSSWFAAVARAAASIITRADFLRSLRREMPEVLAEIRRAGVGPTDIQQAAIGPGIGIFTRYAQVLNTDGTPMLVKDALKLINQVREEITSHGDADYDSETRFALDWFAAKGFDKGRAGDAIVMTNAVNVSLDGVKGAGFFEAKGGDARLLKREELTDNWDPGVGHPGTVWEACQHLVKRLSAEDGGIEAASHFPGSVPLFWIVTPSPSQREIRNGRPALKTRI